MNIELVRDASCEHCDAESVDCIYLDTLPNRTSSEGGDTLCVCLECLNKAGTKGLETPGLTVSEKHKATILRLCDFVTDLQEKGRPVPGHHPRSGVFADCSMACTDNHGIRPCCLSHAARLLKKKIV